MNTDHLKGKVAIVTGAGRGIGRAIALTLADLGVNVALAARSEDALQAVADEIARRGPAAAVLPTDVACEDQVASLVADTVKRFGRLDILVNNAAMVIFKRLAEMSTDEWDRTMAVNARGPFLTCRHALPHLRKHDRSWIINIGSVLAFKGYVDHCAYAASKHAVMGLSKTLARELAADGVRVHVIHPGGVDTAMRFDEDRSVLMPPQAVADVIPFLLSLDGNSTVDEIYVRREASTPWG